MKTIRITNINVIIPNFSKKRLIDVLRFANTNIRNNGYTKSFRPEKALVISPNDVTYKTNRKTEIRSKNVCIILPVYQMKKNETPS